MKLRHSNIRIHPDAIERELVYKPMDVLSLTDIAKALAEIGWVQNSDIYELCSRTIFLDDAEHSLFSKNESLRLRTKMEDPINLVRINHKRKEDDESIPYSIRYMQRASTTNEYDPICQANLFSFMRGISQDVVGHVMTEALNYRGILLAKDGHEFKLSQQDKTFYEPDGNNGKSAITYEIERKHSDIPYNMHISAEFTARLLEEIHEYISKSNMPLKATKQGTYSRGHELIF